MSKPLSLIITLLAAVQVPANAAPDFVTELFSRPARNIIYDTPAVVTDTITIIDENGSPVSPNELYIDGLEIAKGIDENDTTLGDSLVNMPDTLAIEYVDFNPYPLSASTLRPTVFDTFHFLDNMGLHTSLGLLPHFDPYATEWLSRANDQADLIAHARQRYILDHPSLILYNEAFLPEPPKQFTATVDPATATILFSEVLPTTDVIKADLEAKFEKKHWLKSFNANVQFSQAYVSPNWYQGGNNNLNMLLNLFYNVKLNPAFHKDLLFENTFQYKLGMNNAPDDKIRNYSISEDLFQWNMTAGYRSTKHWYYSLNTQFKTQFMNNYKTNTETLKAAFLSPGELNLGVGMTYNIANKKKTFTFDASISPFSYNLKVVRNREMNVKSFGIEPGRHSVSEYGSSAEGKLFWQMCDNISLRSRLFVFSDYDYIQSDFENTLQFTINRYLTTQIYVHMRYDSTSPALEETDWHKFQMKEILSFGFTYKFSSL